MLKHLYRIIEKNDSPSGRAFDYVIVALIISNIISVVLQSYESIYSAHKTLFDTFELVSVIIFSLEYLLRLIVSPYRYSEKYHPKNLIRYVFSFSSLIDLLAIIPYYMPLLISFDLRALRIVRLFRLLRVLKLTRYLKALEIIKQVLIDKKAELIMSTLLLAVVVFFSGSLMYFSENEAQPTKFPNIIESTFWSIRTMIFLGFEGQMPITSGGAFFGTITVLFGLCWITLPISILSSGFIEAVGRRNKKKESE